MSLGIDDLKIDFLNDQIHYNRKILKGKNELIAKAVGLGKGTQKVLDLTLGLAEDAVMLARLGCEVHGYERNKILFQKLQEALEAAKNSNEAPAWIFNLHFYNHDSIEVLNSKVAADAIYIDPMFEGKKKDALPRKEMQIFRNLVGPDPDSEELLRLAIKSGVKRIVVKRALKALPLGEASGFSPSHSFKGSSVRYDLYLPT